MPKIKVGDQKVIRVKITDKMVRDFAELSGDRNPIHLDDEFATKSRFGRRIAHGMLSAAMISRGLAADLPGPGSIYLSQTMKFTAPVYIDEEIEITLTVTELREDKPFATIETICRKAATGETVLEGEAKVLAPY